MIESACNITAVITAYDRPKETVATIERIQDCQPRPNEVIVHIDAYQRACEDAIRQAFPAIKILRSENRVGPGGGRNRLIAAASNEFVASFDDDSYPIDSNYFERAVRLFETLPAASILAGTVFHKGEAIQLDHQTAEWVSDFNGGACVYRRSQFLKTSGYVPLALAYGMEEVDLALRLHGMGGHVLRTPWLRVFHNTDLRRHEDSAVTAASIANVALLAYLRYPRSLWWLGLKQCLSRIKWLLSHGRTKGVIKGLAMIPGHLRTHRQYRKRMETNSIKSYLALRRSPTNVTLSVNES